MEKEFDMIKVSDLARQKVAEVAEAQDRKGDGLMLHVRNGGTSMVQFGLSFIEADQVTDDLITVDAGDFKIHINKENKDYLEGATLNFIDGPQGSGFQVDAPNAQPPRPSGPVAEKIQKVLEEQINPSLASHGGMVGLEGIKDNIVYLRFGGGCQGCGMINTTLKDGVEVAIKQAVPEIEGVMDVTDHAGGKNPYYQPSGGG
jgi:Fe/S biogenesis protein NfuA